MVYFMSHLFYIYNKQMKDVYIFLNMFYLYLLENKELLIESFNFNYIICVISGSVYMINIFPDLGSFFSLFLWKTDIVNFNFFGHWLFLCFCKYFLSLCLDADKLLGNRKQRWTDTHTYTHIHLCIHPYIDI